MKPLEKIYWLRLLLGFLAAVLCAGYVFVAQETLVTSSSQSSNWSLFFNSMSIAIVVYLISYYILKHSYGANVEKPQKLVTTGVGVYFLSWLVFWALLYTLMAGQV